MKLCHVVFSTNRIEYLSRTFESNKKIDFSGLDVDHIFIDDYPLNRDDYSLFKFALENGYTEIILHNENKGITKTWQEFFELIKYRNYDYVFHHEDDVELLYPIKILDLIEILTNDKSLSQIQLKRNNWYPHETEEPKSKNSDVLCKNYRYEKSLYFWMLMSIYPAWISREPFFEETGHCPSESVIANYLYEKYKIGSGVLKTIDGKNIVNHIGEYNQGKKVNEGEPGWEELNFKYFNPNVKYNSKTGDVYI